MAPHADRFVLVLRDPSGPVHEEELDFDALIHDVAFSAVCKGVLPNDGRWAPVGVEPAMANGTFAGVTVRVAGSARTYRRAVFHDRAKEVLRTKGLLELLDTEDGTKVSWEVEVRKADTGEPRGKRVSVRHQAYPFAQRDLAELAVDTPGGEPDALSVCVSGTLAEELRRESANSLDRERADFLIGHLVLKGNGHVVVVLVDRIPADMDTEGSLVHFSFSPLTFQAAQRELERRGTDCVILGHHHNHPPACGHKCLATIPACSTENLFFSIDDRVVHRSAFSRPYMVALVSGKGANRRADDPVIKAYGWQHGVICEREWSVF